MKDERPLDRRVQRTRQLLRDALIALVLEQGYDALTIQAITDRANLGRATFYLHYRDKDELLLDCLETVFDDLAQRIEPLLGENFLGGGPPPSLIAFQHAAEYSDLYRLLLRGRGATAVARRVRDYLAQQIQMRLEALPLPQREEAVPLDLIASYIAGALLALLAWWLEAGMPHPPDYMAQTFQRLNVPGVLAALGVDAAALERYFGRDR